MRIYLTAAPVYADRLDWLRGWLEKQGHRIVSSWFDKSAPGIEDDMAPAVAMIEIDTCDALLVYNPGDRQATLAGLCAASWESGYSWASGKRLFYLGRSPDMFTSRYGAPWPTYPVVPEVKWQAC